MARASKGSTVKVPVAMPEESRPAAWLRSFRLSGFALSLLLLVVASLVVLAPSLKTLVEQRQQIAELQTQLETELMARFSLRTDVYVRTAQAWQALVAANPFPEFAASDPGWLMTLFLKDTPDKKAIGALRAAIRGTEQVRAESRQLYAVYPDGIGGSKLTNGLIEKTLETRITGRNWTTVLALAAMLAD